jgi:hypothetical protein
LLPSIALDVVKESTGWLDDEPPITENSLSSTGE